jgi:sulfite reductase (NADPH) hemoprotein beta-component
MNAPPSKNEQIKEASRFLRGGIADGLSKAETGAIAEDDAQLTKFHGTYLQDDRDLRPERRKKKLEQAYAFMIRVRVPGGVRTPAQWLAMDRIATDYANGTLRLTTRQAFQFHGVIKSNLKRSMQAINTALLDTVAACGDVNRNVMCNPNPYQSKAHAAALELARAISDHLTPRTAAYHEIWLDGDKVLDTQADEEPLYGAHYLPRKFKTVVAVPPSNDVDVFAQDLGFIAIVG